MGDADPLEYEYQIMPLCQMMGERLASVWGQEGKSGFTADRESLATRVMCRILQEKHTNLPLGGTCLPMLEIRSILIGELEGKQIYGFTVLGSSGSLLIRLNAVSSELADMDMQLVTTDDYRERLAALKISGNQEVDAQEALLAGRKFMLWNVSMCLQKSSRMPCWSLPSWTCGLIHSTSDWAR
jgi:hypothetical protein